MNGLNPLKTNSLRDLSPNGAPGDFHSRVEGSARHRPATIKDFSSYLSAAEQRPDLLMVLDPSGQVVARTATLQAEPIPDAAALWVQPSLAGERATGVLTNH